MEPAVPDEILEHYTHEVDEDARLREGAGRLELLRAQQVVRGHLLGANRRILDVGGGTGVHARWLADDGHTVHVVDPVARHVEAVRALGAAGPAITAELGDARSLPVPDSCFDAVLLFGPLYHLVDRDDRLRAWREARRVVRPGGPILAAAISRYAPLFDGLARGFLFEPEFRAIVEDDLRDGRHRNPDRREHWFTTAYFHHPDELRAEMADAGLEALEVLGLEGLAGWLPQLADRWRDPAARDAIVFAAEATATEPALAALSPHLVAVARRPVGH